MKADTDSRMKMGCWPIGDASENSAVRDFALEPRSSVPLWRELELRPGLRVSGFEADLSEGFSFKYQKKNSHIHFGFFLEGNIVNNMVETTLGPLQLDNSAGSGGIGYFSEMSGTVEAKAQGRARIIHLHISPDLLHELLFTDMNVVHDDLRRVLENRAGNDFYMHQAMDPVVQAAANELYYALVGGNCSRIYLEGKALELIGLQVMKFEASRGGRNSGLSLAEIDRIRSIRRELEGKFDSPPTMAEISKAYMMSVSKIQSGFQELYGMTVFAFLKEYKLRKARMLFEDGDMNVSEVAWALGYTNLSHFSAAFKKNMVYCLRSFLLQCVREK